MSFGYKHLEVWQVAMDLVEDIYRIAKEFPKEEMYGLVSQMRRGAISIPSNIAEGKSRSSGKDFRLFLIHSLASASELGTQLEIASRLKYITQKDFDELLNTINRVSKMLSSLVRKLSVK